MDIWLFTFKFGVIHVLVSCGAQKQDSKQIAAAIRAAVPKLTLRSHVLAEAAKLVEIQQPGELWGAQITP